MSDAQVHVVVDNTMGAAYIGVLCAAMLYGVSCVQTWFYFNRYPKDVWYIKTLVTAVWTFDTVHQILISHTGKQTHAWFNISWLIGFAVYRYVITNFDNPTILSRMVWSILLEVLFNGFIGFLVQGFLALRVWRLSSSNIPLTAIVAIVVLAEFACSVAFAIQSMQLHTWIELGKLKGLSMTVNALGVLADTLIVAALFFFLHRSRTGFKKSDTMISRLILFTVSTGLLTTICAIASLLSILIWGKTLIYVAFYFSIGRLYSNSLLATLNARRAIRGLGEDSDELSFSLQSLSKLGQRQLTGDTNASRPTNLSIKIDTIHEYSRDRGVDPQSAATDASYV